MSVYSQYYYNTPPSVGEVECIEIQHFRFNPTVFRLVSNYSLMELSTNDAFGNKKMGAIVTHEGGAGPFEYEFVRMSINRLGSGNDLDQALSITLGDVGTILPQQLERVMSFNAMQAKPIVRYRSYTSIDFSTPLTTVPLVLEIKRVAFNKEGCSFEAIAPYLNATRTGIIYDKVRFPTMSAFFRN